MHLTSMTRLKYEQVARSPEYTTYMSRPRNAPFETPRLHREIVYQARRNIEYVVGRNINSKDYKIELTESILCRSRLGLINEMDVEEDERHDGVDVGGDAQHDEF